MKDFVCGAKKLVQGYLQTPAPSCSFGNPHWLKGGEWAAQFYYTSDDWISASNAQTNNRMVLASHSVASCVRLHLPIAAIKSVTGPRIVFMQSCMKIRDT
jgi:hypothetical protein